MLIDWFTVVAQVLNFVILAWLMKHFLYKPILTAIDKREARIAAELADAAAKQAAALHERETFQAKNKEMDEQRAALIKAATQTAKNTGQELLEQARQAADALRAKREASLLNDWHNMQRALTTNTQQEVFAIARQTLQDMASVCVEARMSDVFIARLRASNDQVKSEMAAALQRANKKAVVESAFDLSTDQRAAIQQALNETFSLDIQLQFKTSPDVISGIAVSTEGQQISWSIAEYLKSLEKNVGALFQQSAQQPAQPSDTVKSV